MQSHYSVCFADEQFPVITILFMVGLGAH